MPMKDRPQTESHNAFSPRLLKCLCKYGPSMLRRHVRLSMNGIGGFGGFALGQQASMPLEDDIQT